MVIVMCVSCGEVVKTKNLRQKYCSSLCRERFYSKQWKQRHKLKNAIHAKVRRAVRSGRVVRPTNCENCFKECVTQAHHKDYNEPLVVRWLCNYCHQHEHAYWKVLTNSYE